MRQRGGFTYANIYDRITAECKNRSGQCLKRSHVLYQFLNVCETDPTKTPALPGVYFQNFKEVCECTQ